MPFDGTELNETAAHLLRAKRYIEEHGWSPCGWKITAAGVERCVLGALTETSASLSLTLLWDGAPWRLMAKAVGRIHIDKWNDTPGRTVEEVYAAFDRAIALAMEPGE